MKILNILAIPIISDTDRTDTEYEYTESYQLKSPHRNNRHWKILSYLCFMMN